MNAADHTTSINDAGADLAAYVAAMHRDDEEACAAIEKKFGLYGLSPQQVAEELAELANREVLTP